jgi:predicted helicase
LKEEGIIEIDDGTELYDIPIRAWDYKPGNRSAVEWVLDEYKEKKLSDPIIAEQLSNYNFNDYKEQLIDLLQRVCTISVETMKIIEEMP